MGNPPPEAIVQESNTLDEDLHTCYQLLRTLGTTQEPERLNSYRNHRQEQQASDRTQFANPDVFGVHALLPQSRHLFVSPALDIGLDDCLSFLRVPRSLIRKQEPILSLRPRHDDQPE